MAIPKIKATYSLDPETIRALETTAARWQVSKSEALRRAIRAAASGASVAGRTERLDALDALQEAYGIDQAAAERWAGDVRQERQATSRASSKSSK